jgi:poly(3-hydroxybutyrate) depolymerase
MMRMTLALFFLLLSCATAAAGMEPGAITKEALTSGGRQRAYYLYVPKSVAASRKAAPLLITLHGSGRDGRILVEHWQAFADSEGLILAGPDSLAVGSTTGGITWDVPRDGPDFMRDVVNDVRLKHAIDERRVYLFGHSAGGAFAIYMAMTESEYFAAAFVHAGVLPESRRQVFDTATRKIPLGVVVGTEDQFYKLDVVRAMHDALAKRGFDSPLTEIPGHDHDYYGLSKEINKTAWNFLRDKRLKASPRFSEYKS